MADITPRIDFSRELSGLFNLKGKVAYVPGGYGGIGEAIAWALALAGAKVAVSGRDLAKAERWRRELRAAGHDATRPGHGRALRRQASRLRSMPWRGTGAASTSWSTASACSASSLCSK